MQSFAVSDAPELHPGDHPATLGDVIPSPFRFHFDFIDPKGEVLMTSERGRSLRDRYLITLPGARLDGRIAAAMAVALDALQSR